MAFETGAIDLTAVRDFLGRTGAETLDGARDYVYTNAPSYNIPANLNSTGHVDLTDFRGITIATPSPTASPTPAPVTPPPTPNPTPAPVTPNPTPSPTPNPTPAPVTPNPTPSPTPNPTPSPTPNPTPAPVTPPPTPPPTPAPVTPPPTPPPTPAPTPAPVGGCLGTTSTGQSGTYAFSNNVASCTYVVTSTTGFWFFSSHQPSGASITVVWPGFTVYPSDGSSSICDGTHGTSFGIPTNPCPLGTSTAFDFS